MTSAPVVYWDGSAVLSALVRCASSERALAVLRQPAVHLLSTLAWTETSAELGRLTREGALTEDERRRAREMLARGPWRLTYAYPERRFLDDPAEDTLGAAARWHLATARTLARQLPELRVLSFRARLREAARGRRIAAD